MRPLIKKTSSFKGRRGGFHKMILPIRKAYSVKNDDKENGGPTLQKNDDVFYVRPLLKISVNTSYEL